MQSIASTGRIAETASCITKSKVAPSNKQNEVTLLHSHVRVPLSEMRHVPRSVQFIGQLYLEIEVVYLHVLESSPFTPTNHFPAHTL